MNLVSRSVHSLVVPALVVLLIPFWSGCSAECQDGFGGECLPSFAPAAQYSTLSIPRNGKDNLTLYVVAPTEGANGKGILVAHPTSDDSETAAAEFAAFWALRFLGDGYTIIAHAYDEADSAYGQYDVEDTLDAIDWLSGDGTVLIPLDGLFLAGTSRGGNIAYQVAFQVAPDKLDGIIADRGVSNFLLPGFPLKAILSGLFGENIERAAWQTIEWIGALPEDDPEAWKAISAGYNIDRIQVPMLILHGSDDVLVPFAQATDFQERAAAAGRDDFRFTLIEGRGHLNLDFDPAVDEAIREFLQTY
jgi:dipeptidyl aminopeptidase/acylaminoacyl peptidase